MIHVLKFEKKCYVLFYVSFFTIVFLSKYIQVTLAHLFSENIHGDNILNGSEIHPDGFGNVRSVRKL